jgi:CHAT domain-containing protein
MPAFIGEMEHRNELCMLQSPRTPQRSKPSYAFRWTWWRRLKHQARVRRILGIERVAVTIQSMFPQSTKLPNRTKGTVAAVCEGMKTHSWVHLAFHGIQDSPNSAFSLDDGKLKLSTLMTQSLPCVELAFLSACKTASGDQELCEVSAYPWRQRVLERWRRRGRGRVNTRSWASSSDVG